jgi:hypothetical protein
MRLLYFIPFLFITLLAVADEPGRPSLLARPEAFPTLVNPKCSHCRDEAKRRAGELRDEDRLLCWIRGYSDGGAIPFRFFLNKYPVISDTYGVFVRDPDAGFARGFAPSLDFRFYGWRNGVMVMRHKDGTLYSCLSGLAFEGPKKGARLKVIPTLVSDWGYWLKHYPQTVAYHMFDKYQPMDVPAKASEESRKSRGPVDPRLPAETLVLGVYDGGKATAYPLLTEVLVRTCVEKDRVILWYGPTHTAAAYHPVAEPPAGKAGKPRPITLETFTPGPSPAWRDKETGSTWDITGRAVAGQLKGWTLPWIDSVQVKWFAWSAEHPKTEIRRIAHFAPARDDPSAR